MKQKHWNKIGYFIGKCIGWLILGFITYWIIWAIASIGVKIKQNMNKKPIKELLNKKQRNRTLELWIALLGFIIGGMLGMWMLIEIVKLSISK